MALLGVCIYAFVKWDFDSPSDRGGSEFAEQACVDAIRDRFDTTSIRPYAVKKNNKGYVVRASVILANGKPAKTYCLTNEHGGVKEVGIEAH